jgi:alginate O-acetyltransferase complex protein AlgI
MVFSSPEFIFLFLPITLMAFYLFGRASVHASRVWLLLSSLFFYGFWEPSYLIIIIGSLIFNYIFSNLLRPTEFFSEKFRKDFLIGGISANLLLIGIFKYFDFMVVNINYLSNQDFTLHHILLPLGISFFTFQQIAYLVDTYKGKTKKGSFVNYSLFITFFPQLIAGPIVRHNEMMPQFEQKNIADLDWEHIAKALYVFTIGLCKKVIFADTFAVWANSGFDYAGSLSFFEAWSTSLCYTFQIYFDFSGYADMAIGAALLLNIRLPINFNSPYKAISINDFWRRWHITLSAWLRDYLYIPLGGNRKGEKRRYVNLMATMLIGGLWHGAAWNFVLWGGAHGIALAAQSWWNKKSHFNINRRLGWVATFLLVNFLWVPFRATTLRDTLKVWKGMLLLNENAILISNKFAAVLNGLLGFSNQNTFFSEGYTAKFYGGTLATIPWLLIGAIVVFIAPNSMQMIDFIHRSESKFGFTGNLRQAVIWGAIWGFACTWMMTSHGTEFIYFNF